MDDPLELFTTLIEAHRFDGKPMRISETDRRGREAHCRLFFAEFTADFCFILQGAAPGLRNYLTVRIFQPERGEAATPLFVSLSEALFAVHPDRYVSCEYPFIASEEQLRSALEELYGIFEAEYPALRAHMADRGKRAELFSSAAEELNAAYGEEVYYLENGSYTSDEDLEYLESFTRMFSRMKTARRFMPPYTFFYENKPEKALRGLVGYANRDRELSALSELAPEKAEFSEIQKELYRLYKRSDRLSALPKVAAGTVLTVLAGVIPALLCFIPAYFAAAGSFSPATVFSTASAGQSAFLFYPVFLFGAVLMLFDQRIMMRMLYGKKLARAYANMTADWERRLMRTAGSLLFAVLICGTILMGNKTVRFEEERFADSRKFFSLEETYHSYDEIDRAAYVTDADGDRIILLELRDGTVIGLSGVSERTADKRILPLLTAHGVTVETNVNPGEGDTGTRSE